MAAKAKDISHGKENHGKKNLRSSASIPSSPDRAIPTLSTDKPIPNYLRHTISSAKDTSSKLTGKDTSSKLTGKDTSSKLTGKDISSKKDTPSKLTGKKPSIDDGSPRSSSRRKSLDRPPPQGQLQRTLSSSSREKATKPSSPSPKVTSSSRPGSSSEKTTSSTPKTVSSDKIINSSMKPVVEKTSKVAPRVVKSTHHQPVVAKTKTFKRTTSNVSSSSSKQLDFKGDTSPTITTTTTTTTTTDVLEVSGVEVEQEDKGILEQEVVDGPDILKVEEDEEIPFEIPLDHDQAVILQNINHIEPEHLEENDQTPTEITEATMEIDEEEVVVVKMSSPQTEETQDKTIDQIQIEEHHDENEEQQQLSTNEEDKKAIEDAPSESQPEIVEIEEETEVLPEENIVAAREGGGEEEVVINEKSSIVNGEIKSPGSENEETKAYKMKFRQGKELEVEVEDGGNQRLKFKEKERSEDEEEEMKDEAGNVILKKQEVNKGKKESQAYNDVIEETASKLVGKRKSKVKALVGAFETVISLEGTEGQ